MTDTEFYLTVAGVPIPQGSKGVSKSGRMFEANKNTKGWRETVTRDAELMVDMMDGWEPLDCPVNVSLVFWLPRPKSHYGTGRNTDQLKPGMPRLHATKPDADKLTRAVFDSLTAARVWVDDSRAAEVTISKRYTDPGSECVSIILRPTT